MAQFSDDLFVGNFSIGSGLLPLAASSADPTINSGVGPAGRAFFRALQPLTAQINNVALSQHMTATTALTLTAGTGTTSVAAPDQSGPLVVKFDCARAVSISSTSDLHLINFTVTGYDEYSRLTTQKLAGPNNSTVNTLKTFMYVLSAVPDTTDGTHNVSVGTSDILGMQYRVFDKTYLVSVLWANSFTTDTGTFTIADDTTPATNATGDPRGTYLPSSASNGTRRLTICMHLDQNQCGKSATVTNVIGVTPA